MQNYNGVQAQLNCISMIVLDEADRLLDMGFKPQLDTIVALLPRAEQRQTQLFSATFPPNVADLTSRTLKHDHAVISCVGDDEDQTHHHVKQESVIVPLAQQFEALYELIAQHKAANPNYKVIVFFTTARVASFASCLFNQANCPTLELHSRLSQSKRTKTSEQFRDGARQVLFSSDVSARGLDFPNVSLIIQLGLTAADQYVHRLGRTARAGQEGHAYAYGLIVLAPFESRFLQTLTRTLPIAALAAGQAPAYPRPPAMRKGNFAHPLLAIALFARAGRGILIQRSRQCGRGWQFAASSTHCMCIFNDVERRVQPRHFHFGPNPVAASAGGDGAAAESAGPPPAARLYRHALESIFGWLNQRELVTALQVSKDWLAAVKSMASLQLKVGRPSAPLRVVARSAMGRHVTQLGSNSKRVRLTADALFILAHHMEQLRELICDVNVTPSEGPLTFPPALQTLQLNFNGEPAAADVNATIRAISHLPLLESLTIRLNSIGDQLSFAPLAVMPLLRRFAIRASDDDTELSDAQVAELRALPLLRGLQVWPMPTSLLRRLPAQPHDLQWQRISLPNPLSDKAAGLLPHLPSLVELGDDTSVANCSHFDFLRRLPKLTDVNFGISEPSLAGRMESLVAGLQCCSRIESLQLISSEVTAAHLNELLPRLPRLRRFHLAHSRITTLAFLAQPPMRDQLTFIRLIDCRRLPLTELRHVHALRGLKELILLRSFDAPMDAHCRSLYTPPSVIMPQLEKFIYRP